MGGAAAGVSVHSHKEALPVLQLNNVLRRWQQYQANQVAPPPYEELLTAALADITVLHQHAVGNVQAAYLAGRNMALGQERAAAMYLHGLDLLAQALGPYTALTGDEATDAEAAAAHTALRQAFDSLVPVLLQALAYRQAGLEAAAVAAAEAALSLDRQNEALALATEQAKGPVGPPVVPLGADPHTGALHVQQPAPRP